MSPMSSYRVTQAIKFAATSHFGQVDKSGLPYIFHPIGVARRVSLAGGSEDAVIAAVLHDVVEDCGISLEKIAGMFGSNVARIVGAVTRQKD